LEGWTRFVAGALADWQRADLAALLSATDGLEEKVKIIQGELRLRPDDAEAFRKKVGSQRKASELPPLENAIRMYGVMNAVPYTILCKLSDILDPKALPKDPETGTFNGNPKVLLPYVGRIRAVFAQDDARCRDSAIAAALVFDLLALSNQSDPSAEVRRKVTEALERGFERAIGAIRIGLALARRMKRLSLESEIPAAILLYEAGQAAAASYVPSYADAAREWAKNPLSPGARFLDESSRFGVASAAFAHACSWIAPVLDAAGTAASAMLMPFALTPPKERDAADLASLCMLSIFLFSRPTYLVGTKPVRASQLRPEFSLLDLTFVPAEVKGDAA
jgi:hypothetical protein